MMMMVVMMTVVLHYVDSVFLFVCLLFLLFGFKLSTVAVPTWILAVFYPVFRVLLLPWFLQGALSWEDIFMPFSIRFIMFVL